VLVVVDVVAGVAMVAVDVVDVVLVRDGQVAAAALVDMHVAGVREVVVRGANDRVHVVDVVLVDVVDVPVVEEVHVVPVRNGGVPAEPVVHVRMRLEATVGRGVGHREPPVHTVARFSRRRQTKVPGLKPSGFGETLTWYDNPASNHLGGFFMTDSARNGRAASTCGCA
jgi:hypothetical protein